MSGRLRKIAPTAIVAAVLGYLCWPYVTDPEAAAGQKKESTLPVLTAALLSPPPEPAPDRDPFSQGKNWSAAVTAKKPKDTPKKPPPIENTLSGQILNATYVHGARRLALISGQVYAEGEALKGQNSSSSPLKVARICPDKVLLCRDGVTVELKYASAWPKPGDAAAPAMKQQPGVDATVPVMKQPASGKAADTEPYFPIEVEPQKTE
jgi:hypothetical protein